RDYLLLFLYLDHLGESLISLGLRCRAARRLGGPASASCPSHGNPLASRPGRNQPAAPRHDQIAAPRRSRGAKRPPVTRRRDRVAVGRPPGAPPCDRTQRSEDPGLLRRSQRRRAGASRPPATRTRDRPAPTTLCRPRLHVRAAAGADPHDADAGQTKVPGERTVRPAGPAQPTDLVIALGLDAAREPARQDRCLRDADAERLGDATKRPPLADHAHDLVLGRDRSPWAGGGRVDVLAAGCRELRRVLQETRSQTLRLEPQAVADVLERERPPRVGRLDPHPRLGGELRPLANGADLSRQTADRILEHRPHQRAFAGSRTRLTERRRLDLFRHAHSAIAPSILGDSRRIAWGNLSAEFG